MSSVRQQRLCLWARSHWPEFAAWLTLQGICPEDLDESQVAERAYDFLARASYAE